MAITLLALFAVWLALWLLQAWLLGVWVYRKGFRDAIDFLDGRRPLPRIIISWRGALRGDREKD